VNGAGALGRATGSESNFGNGDRATDQTGSKGHCYRETGGGASRQRSRATGNRADTGHRPPSLRARRAMYQVETKANARRSTGGGSSHLSGSPGWVRRRKSAAPPGATH
jgi:hypothetical protein